MTVKALMAMYALQLSFDLSICNLIYKENVNKSSICGENLKIEGISLSQINPER